MAGQPAPAAHAHHSLRAFPRSFRTAPHDATRVRDVDDGHRVGLTIVLRPGVAIHPASYAGGRHISREEYRARHRTTDAVMRGMEAFVTAHGLTVDLADAGRHVIKVSGTYAQARAAFQPVGLGVWRTTAGAEFVAREGHLSVPAALAGDIVAVMGFDQRPVARPHFRRIQAHATTSTYDPAQIAARYQFPTGVDGTGQTIAIIELGGGYDDADVAAYFTEKGIARTGTLTSAGVDGGVNGGQNDPQGADGEVQLDIDVAGSVAPGANLVVIFAPNQGSGFVDAVGSALHDQTPTPCAVSISWGGPESGWTSQDIDAFDQALQGAAALGVTVCVASGDNGSVDNSPDGQNTVDFPASSPNALACGGTSLPSGGSEVAWNNGAGGGASGGGYSAHFAQPSYQAGVVSHAGRGVPDVSGDADPQTGYNVRVDGNDVVVGGTSAVAPLYAGLIALIAQSLGRAPGFVNPALYASPQAFTDITSGNNGAYAAGPGWDPVTGLGSPLGGAILQALRTTTATS